VQTPAGIRTLLITTVMGFLLEMGAGEPLLDKLALWPLQSGFMPWQLLTYAFLHASLPHLAFNMLGLWMFGREMEYLLGQKATLQLYFASVLSAGIMQLLVTGLTGSVYPTVGASGGVFGMLLAYAMFFPHRIIVLLFPPIPLPAWLFVTLYAGLELVLGVSGTQAGVAHFAHLGGMIGGYLVILRWRRQSSRWR
jgi:membrane associated rhomboid family serine protease